LCGVTERAYIMPGDPKECKEHAMNCTLLAKQASTEESKQTFLNLSKSWTTLANELEDAETFLKAISEIEVSNPPPGKNNFPPKGQGKRRARRQPEPPYKVSPRSYWNLSGALGASVNRQQE